jgi:hypothetical protein
MKEYAQFDWQVTKIKGKLKPIGLEKIVGSNGRLRKVRAYIDEANEVFIKNPYNVNFLALKECER